MTNVGSDKKKDKKDKEYKEAKSKKKKETPNARVDVGNTSTIGKQTSSGKKTNRCFICNGPHLAWNCPKRENVANAIVEELSGSQKAELLRLNSLQLVSAITTQHFFLSSDGLIYVQALVNGVSENAMVDIGATHSFVASREISRLKLQLKEHSFKIKAVNFKLDRCKAS